MTPTELLEGYTDRLALAVALSISPRTIARYEKDGLPSMMLGGRKLYNVEAVATWLKRREAA